MINPEDVVVWALGGFLAVITVVVGFAVWSEATSEKISITKSEWSCTQTATKTILMPMGKVILPQLRTECVKYERDGEKK